MKKFLAILLIAIVACSTVSVVEEEEFDLEKIKLPNWLKKGWSKLKEKIKKVVEFLKENKLWEPILDFVKKNAVAAAKKYCYKYLEQEFCDELVDGAEKIIPILDKN